MTGITLKSGRVFELHGAGDEVIGIGANLEISEGYDSSLDEWTWTSSRMYDDDEPSPFSVTEKMEICDVMIDRWQRLKERVGLIDTCGILLGEPQFGSLLDWQKREKGYPATDAEMRTFIRERQK